MAVDPHSQAHAFNASTRAVIVDHVKISLARARKFNVLLVRARKLIIQTLELIS